MTEEISIEPTDEGLLNFGFELNVSIQLLHECRQSADLTHYFFNGLPVKGLCKTAGLENFSFVVVDMSSFEVGGKFYTQFDLQIVEAPTNVVDKKT